MTKEELEGLVWKIPATEIAKQCNMSDSGLRKVCDRLGVEKPPVGYWAKIKVGISHEVALEQCRNLREKLKQRPSGGTADTGHLGNLSTLVVTSDVNAIKFGETPSSNTEATPS